MKQYDVTDLTDAFAQGSDATPRSVQFSMADFNEAEYRPYLDGLDLTDKQASELLRIVWDIMHMWVEMDLPADSCGQIVKSIIHPNQDETDSVDQAKQWEISRKLRRMHARAKNKKACPATE